MPRLLELGDTDRRGARINPVQPNQWAAAESAHRRLEIRMQRAAPGTGWVVALTW
jgi:hypothetical protein